MAIVSSIFCHRLILYRKSHLPSVGNEMVGARAVAEIDHDLNICRSALYNALNDNCVKHTWSSSYYVSVTIHVCRPMYLLVGSAEIRPTPAAIALANGLLLMCRSIVLLQKYFLFMSITPVMVVQLLNEWNILPQYQINYAQFEYPPYRITW